MRRLGLLRRQELLPFHCSLLLLLLFRKKRWMLLVHPEGAGGRPGGVRALPWLKVFCAQIVGGDAMI